MVARAVLRMQNEDAINRIANAAASISSDNVDVQEKAEEMRNARGRDYEHTATARLQKLAELLEAVQEAQGLEPAEPTKRTVDDLESVNATQKQNLKNRGMSDINVLRNQPDDALLDVYGISHKTIEDIRAEIGYPDEEE